jgi:hypothetical protein
VSDYIETSVISENHVHELLSQTKLTGWLAKIELEWVVERVIRREGDNAHKGWLIAATFMRPDSVTGKMERGTGRQEFLPIKCPESRIVKTAWLCLELLIRHELMEAFTFQGVRILDPHKDLNELAHPKTLHNDDN